MAKRFNRDPFGDDSRFKTPLFFKLWFGFIMLCILGGFVFSIFVFKDCTDRGYAMFQCAAAMNNGHYVAVDNIDSDEF